MFEIMIYFCNVIYNIYSLFSKSDTIEMKKLFKSIRIAVVLLMTLSTVVFSSTFYVNNQTGLDSYNGLSQDVGAAGVGPKLTMRSAIEAAVNGDTILAANTGFPYGDVNTIGKKLTFTVSGGTVTVANMIITDTTKFIGLYELAGTGTMTLYGVILNANNIRLQSGGTIIRTSGSLDVPPVFTGAVNVSYSSISLSADLVTGNELPADTTKLRNLTVDVVAGAAKKVILNSNITVNGTLSLKTGILDLATNGTFVRLAAGSTVEIAAGSLNAPVTPVGAYNLTYVNGTSTTATANEWPPSAAIATLTISMGSTTPANADLFLFDNKVITNFTLSCKTDSSAVVLTDAASTKAYTLTVTGITTLIQGSVKANVSGSSFVLQGDVQVSGGSISRTVRVAFTGSTNQSVKTPSGGVRFGNITMNKTYGSNIVKITGGDLTCLGEVTFNNGLIATDASNALVLTNSGGLSVGRGFVRSIAAGGKSHVVGNVKQNLQHADFIAYARNEFPVGDTVNYRPVALTFVTPGSSGLMGIFATVSHSNARPSGTAGLPIENGISPGIQLAKYPGFYWSIKTDMPMDSSQKFDLDLTADGFNPSEINLNDVGTNHVKIIRRSGTASDAANRWNLLGADYYDNFISFGIPSVVAINSNGGLTTTGEIFTYGMPPPPINPIPDLILRGPTNTNLTKKIKLTTVFPRAVGALTFIASSSNTAIVTVAIIAPDTLLVSGLREGGPVVVTVTATDIDSRITISFNVSVRYTKGVEKTIIPTEPSLSQNYPNPFNPSTTIAFGLPTQAIVTMDIYDVLGVKIRTLIHEKQMNAGFHQIEWNGKDDAGVSVACGVYLYRINAGTFTLSRKMVMLK
jgi:hypothetical protein